MKQCHAKEEDCIRDNCKECPWIWDDEEFKRYDANYDLENEIETLTFLLENAETEEEKAEIENQLVEIAVAMEIKEEIERKWNK
jgi:hypothetical protein